MRILVVSQYFWPETFRINDLAVILVERGHQVTVLTGWPNYPDGRVFPEFAADPGAFASLKGVEVLRVPLVPRGRGAFRLAVNYLSFVVTACTLGPWRLRGRGFDAILTFGVSPITVGIPSALLRWLKRAPQVLWVLDLWPESLRAVGVIRSERILSWVGLGVGAIYRRCDLIAAQSRAFFDNIRLYAGACARVEYLPAWTDQVFDAQGPVSRAAEVPAAPGVFTVLFAGNVGEAQDFPAILDAATLLRSRADVRWVIVGDGRAADWVRGEVRRRGLESQVLMTGRHPLDRMPEFFACADALLASLRADPVFSLTIPGKIQSYLGAGLPLLVMLDGEGARLVAESGAGLACASGDSAALAAHVVRLAEMAPGERALMGERGRHLSAEAFDRDKLITRLEGWLQQLSGRGRTAEAQP